VEIKVDQNLWVHLPVSKSGPLEYRLDKNRTWEKLNGEWKNQNHLSRTEDAIWWLAYS